MWLVARRDSKFAVHCTRNCETLYGKRKSAFATPNPLGTRHHKLALRPRGTFFGAGATTAFQTTIFPTITSPPVTFPTASPEHACSRLIEEERRRFSIVEKLEIYWYPVDKTTSLQSLQRRGWPPHGYLLCHTTSTSGLKVGPHPPRGCSQQADPKLGAQTPGQQQLLQLIQLSPLPTAYMGTRPNGLPSLVHSAILNK
eukprot:1176194-Prorocentrum_minimum.AAC.3